MAFSFGTPFGGSSASAFGASSAPGFGAAPSSTPAFGASPAPSLFGGAFGATTSTAPTGTTGAFGATPFGSTPNPFGQSAAAQPAGASTTSLFGAAPATQPTTSIFGASGTSAPSLFGAPPALPSSQPASLFQQQQPANLFQQQQARPGLNYKTKFEELPPNVQQDLQRIQHVISSYRDECKALDNDARLQDSTSLKQSLDAETAALGQTLQSLYKSVNADDEAMMAFREKVLVLLRSTETAVRLYQRSKAWRELSQAGPNQVLSQALQDQLAQPVQLPNPYLQFAVRSFQESLEHYNACICELERVLPAALAAPGGDDATTLQSLPVVVSRLHDYFVHVAARLEKLHVEVGRMRDSYLAQRRAMGDYGDPFAEARPLHHLASGPARPSGRGAALGGGGGAQSSSTYGGGPSGTAIVPAGPSGLNPSAPASSSFSLTAGSPMGGAFGTSPGPFGAVQPGGALGTPAPPGGSADRRNSGRTSSNSKKR